MISSRVINPHARLVTWRVLFFHTNSLPGPAVDRQISLPPVDTGGQITGDDARVLWNAGFRIAEP